VSLADRSQWANTSFAFARQLKKCSEISRVVVQGAILRDESRGRALQARLPERNDEKFLKTRQGQLHRPG